MPVPRLPFDHSGEDAFLSLEFGRDAGFRDTAIVKYDDLIGVGDCAHPMGDDKHHPVAHQFGDCALDFGPILHVERGGSLVQQDNRSIFQQGAGDRDPLVFAAGECLAILVDNGIVTLRHNVYYYRQLKQSYTYYSIKAYKQMTIVICYDIA